MITSKYFTGFEDYLLADANRKRVTFFCKGLYGFLLLKVAFVWPVLREMVSYSRFEFTTPGGQFIGSPELLTTVIYTFCITFILVLVAGLIMGINYITSVLIWVFSFTLSRMMAPVENGSDLVLNLFLLLAIFLPHSPEFKSIARREIQNTISNFFLLLCKIQFSCIYLQSGVNKLMSGAWRSGDAVYSIFNLEYFTRPDAPVVFSGVMVYVAWAIIIFEVCFPIVVWFRSFRVPALIAALIFHLTIIFYLGIPDFGLLMIIGCVLFLPDSMLKINFTKSLRSVPQH